MLPRLPHFKFQTPNGRIFIKASSIFAQTFLLMKKSNPFQRQTFHFFSSSSSPSPLRNLFFFKFIYAMIYYFYLDNNCSCWIQSSNSLVILSMEDNQWCLYDHDPLLLTDVSFQQESSSYNTHCSNCKNPFTFFHSFSFSLLLKKQKIKERFDLQFSSFELDDLLVYPFGSFVTFCVLFDVTALSQTSLNCRSLAMADEPVSRGDSPSIG